MKKFTSSKGFTLIELLVVIAIIGILASVVLVSLSTARSKGKDAAVQEQMSSLRSAIELQANGGDYNSVITGGTPPTSSGNTQSILTGIASQATNSYVTGSSSATGWIVKAQLSSGYWCVDGSGSSGSSTTNNLSAATCPSN